jgi:hypothetical protein
VSSWVQRPDSRATLARARCFEFHSQSGDGTEQNLITLCSACPDRLHGGGCHQTFRPPLKFRLQLPKILLRIAVPDPAHALRSPRERIPLFGATVSPRVGGQVALRSPPGCGAPGAEAGHYPNPVRGVKSACTCCNEEAPFQLQPAFATRAVPVRPEDTTSAG